MKSNSLTLTILSALLAIFIFGCDDDDSSKASIEDVIPSTADGEELPVSLNATTNVGEMGFDVSSIDTSDEAVEAFGTYLEDGTIEVDITSASTSTTYSITDGIYVTGTPSAPGEYTYTVSEDQLLVDFYNEYNGVMLDATKEYYATITVHENDYFDAGIYTVSINLI